jgi:hypothetical protein
MTDDEMRAKLGDAMDGLTSAWAAIETVLVELRDRELRAEAKLNHPAGSERAARIMERVELEKESERQEARWQQSPPPY